MRVSLFSSLLTAATIFSHGAIAAPAHEDIHHAKRADQPRILTTGAQGSGIQPRLEIHQLMENTDQWNLYILAMRRYMDTDNDNPLGKSFLAVSGIHGVPGAGWGNIPECDQCGKTKPPAYGFCQHQSINFPGFHRVYLAFFEQILVENAVAIANQYPRESRARMMDAALKLRQPYSDWAALAPKSEGSNFPKVFLSPKITVQGPQGQVTVDNPLFSYKFANPAAGTATRFRIFPQWHNTLRWPTSAKPDAQSQPQKSADSMNAIHQNLREMIFTLLSNCPSFQSMSNSNGGSRQCSNSLESIHNSVHAAVGGSGPDGSNGHMASLPFSAFDPFFMVHHTAVDRFLCFWQVLNPGAWGATQPIGFSSWTYPLGTVQDANSDLPPFFKDNSGKFWTTNDIRDWTIFNYQYPEFLASDGSKDAISSLVSALYGPHANLTAGSIPVPNSKSASQPSSAPRPATKPTRDAPTPSTPAGAPMQNQPAAAPPNAPTQNQPAAAPPNAPTQNQPAAAPANAPTQNQPAAAPANEPAQNQSGSAATPPPAQSSVTPESIEANPNNITQQGTSGEAPAWLVPGVEIEGLNDWLEAHGDNRGQIQGQYLANIVSDANALGGRYTVWVFKDGPTEQPSSYWHDTNLIGSVVMMAHSNFSTGYQTYGAVPLSFYLQKMVKEGQLSSTEDTVVLPWLKEHLQWRIVGPDGQVVSPDKVDGFVLSIYSSRSQILTPAGLPHWEPVQPQLDVTKDSPGGAAKEPDFATRITHGLLGQPGGGADSIGSEIAQVVGASIKSFDKVVSSMTNAVNGAAPQAAPELAPPQRPASGQAPPS